MAIEFNEDTQPVVMSPQTKRGGILGITMRLFKTDEKTANSLLVIIIVILGALAIYYLYNTLKTPERIPRISNQVTRVK